MKEVTIRVTPTDWLRGWQGSLEASMAIFCIDNAVTIHTGGYSAMFQVAAVDEEKGELVLKPITRFTYD